MLLTGTESIQKAEQQAKQADERAQQERQRAERLAAKLRELGIVPDLV